MRMPANCNYGIRKASFPYVAILHDGDRFKPDLIEQWYNAISKHENVGFVFNSIGITDANDNLISYEDDFKEGVVSGDFLLKKVYFRRWMFNSPVYGEAMVRKKLFEENGYLKKKYGFYADVDFWMELLHKNDAYYCADTLITGPAKVIQPRLFDDNLVKTFLYMFSMQLAHRKKAFRNKPLVLAKELAICWVQAFINVNYRLLLLVKNFSFRSFMNASKLLKKSAVFLIPWFVILIFYPLLYPFLRLFTIVKGMFVKPPAVEPAKLSTSAK